MKIRNAGFIRLVPNVKMIRLAVGAMTDPERDSGRVCQADTQVQHYTPNLFLSLRVRLNVGTLHIARNVNVTATLVAKKTPVYA